MAATFNLLRGRDLIWNYVVNNYLLGEEPAPFDLLHWNSDTTNLPAELAPRLSRDALQGEQAGREGRDQRSPGRADRHRHGRRRRPTSRPGREDHIAPPESVWKIMDHFAGPKRFVLAGSGHIAGVVNPPAAQKYQYWVNDQPAQTLEAFIDGATEHKGSWWPDWLEWLKEHGSEDGRRRRARGSRARASSRRSRTRLGATSRRAELPVWTRLARPNERLDLEELQHRASLALHEYREQLDAQPGAIELAAGADRAWRGRRRRKCRPGRPASP